MSSPSFTRHPTAFKKAASLRSSAFLVLPVFAILAVVSTAPLIVFLCGLTLTVIILLLLQDREPPILLLPPLFQWSEVALVPISTVWKRVPLNDLSIYGANLEQAAVYGLAGVVALAIGLRLGMGRVRRQGLAGRIRAEAMSIGFKRVAMLAGGLMLVGYGFSILSGYAGGARELFHQASNLRYAGLFVLIYWCLLRRRRLFILAAVIAFEIIFGMTGFFAQFKNSLLTLIVAAVAARPKLIRRDQFFVAGSLALLILVAIFWSAIKMEYRHFVNRGTGAQVVLVPLSDRVMYITRSAINFSAEDFMQGFDLLVKRHGYIEFLGLTMDYVPGPMPHENGALTFAVLRHISMPRFIFRGKAPLPSDTEITARYTGLGSIGNQNTSISIGHLGELYVDFGLIGGALAMMVIGLLASRVYSALRAARRPLSLLNAGLCLMVVLPLAYFGTAYAKLIGAFVFSTAIAIAFQRVAIPMLPANLKRLMRPPRQYSGARSAYQATHN